MNLFTKSKLNLLTEKLKTAHTIAVVSHFNPDGDAIGSSLALYHYFSNEGYDVKVIVPNNVSAFLAWMPGMDKALVAEHHLKTAKKILKEADVLFFVDMNATHRSGVDLDETLATSPAFKVLIDHHLSPDIQCDVQFSTTQTTSTCELVYEFLSKMSSDKSKINKEVATCIYVGMITDTGSLSYMCNSPKTYLIISELMKRGVDGEEIHRQVYDNYGESRLRLLGLCLSQRLVLMPEYKTSYMYLTKKDLHDNHYVVGDTEGIVNYGLSMGAVRFTAFFTERDDRIRVSFRSKGDFAVNVFAQKYFNGGGHKNASAGSFYGKMEDAIRLFENAVKEFPGLSNLEKSE